MGLFGHARRWSAALLKTAEEDDGDGLADPVEFGPKVVPLGGGLGRGDSVMATPWSVVVEMSL